jgi:deoxyhypusine synthase
LRFFAREDTGLSAREKKQPAGGRVLQSTPIDGRETTPELLQKSFLAYGGRELRTAWELLERAVREDYTIVLTLSGAMTPADLARSCINPLIERGVVDLVCTTGANLYHDAHRSLGHILREGSPHVDDRMLRREQIIRIYDIFFDEQVLLETDRFFSRVLQAPEFQRPMTTAELHFLLGKYLREVEERLGGAANPSLLATCHRHGVPIFCGAPQDGSIFLNVVKLARLRGEAFRFSLDLAADVFEYAAYQYLAKSAGSRKMAVIILGGGVPKNYTLQGEPLMSQILDIEVGGFDIDIQISDANVHTGGLSGCPAGEGHTWGKTTAEYVANSVYCHGDVTQLFPLLVHALAQSNLRREPRRLVGRRAEALARLAEAVEARRPGLEAGLAGDA